MPVCNAFQTLDRDDIPDSTGLDQFFDFSGTCGVTENMTDGEIDIGFAYCFDDSAAGIFGGQKLDGTL